ncbi:hypothetical protein DFJ58DRAFT_157921 [Suillus subalutaceus]|uniref:uncharacterized protein n=1 Tax=Suillus subalutaceus TaxID=48586 RepID=UPI001B867E91|nr:uncharacterized protein DFJ58DRAFT_157921 [Suillus subalutaceus]KAG1836979.1 hypothetical protein DFJ58DRAFT_157921 [Suillus subalutaceus]
MRLFPLNTPSSCTHPVLILLFTMSYRGVSRLRPTATLRLVTSTPNPDTDEDSNSSLSSFSSHSEEKLSRGGTEAHQIEPAETPPRIRVPLARQTEIDNNTVADNIDRKETVAEPTQVDEDWKMRSPSPIELNYAPIEFTYAPTHFHQLYEYQDIVMASPLRSPTPNEVQDSATWGSPWGADLPRSPTPKEVHNSSTWGSSSWGADPPRCPTPNEVQDSATWESSWGADPSHSPTPKEVQDSSIWGSSSWGADPPHSPTPTQVQDSSTWGSSPWETDPSHSPTQDSATRGSSTW